MTDPLEERLRRLRPSVLPDEVRASLANPPPRRAAVRRKVIWISSAAAASAAAAAMAILWNSDAPPGSNATTAPVLADTTTRRVEDARPLAVIAEGQRAWELVEVQWVDESTLTSTADGPLAVQASNTHRTIVPVEIMLD
jgi:hypothetical protein